MSRRAPAAVVDLLAQVGLFAGCTRRELGDIAGLGTDVVVTASTALTTQGRAGAEFMLVISGQARCFIDDIEVGAYGPGDYFGELALLDGGPRAATIVADTDMELLVLDRGEFFQLLDTSPSISRQLLITMAGYQRAQVADPLRA
jgi:CRP/FNR family transcriptional regulator, cyclic AMP receptor protein